jgi:hypothetical protein
VRTSPLSPLILFCNSFLRSNVSRFEEQWSEPSQWVRRRGKPSLKI